MPAIFFLIFDGWFIGWVFRLDREEWVQKGVSDIKMPNFKGEKSRLKIKRLKLQLKMVEMRKL